MKIDALLSDSKKPLARELGEEELHDEEGGEVSEEQMKECGLHIIGALASKDPVAVFKAFQEAFELHEMIPHEDGGEDENPY